MKPGSQVALLQGHIIWSENSSPPKLLADQGLAEGICIGVHHLGAAGTLTKLVPSSFLACTLSPNRKAFGNLVTRHLQGLRDSCILLVVASVRGLSKGLRRGIWA